MMWEKEAKQKERYESMNLFWGDNPDEKDQADIRITSTNINGLACPEELSQYIIASKQFDSDINCFQEVNLDTNQGEVVQEMRKAIRDVDETRGSMLQVSSPPEDRSTTKGRSCRKKKNGGTMIHIEQKWTGSSTKTSQDELGRWSRVTMEGKGHKKVTIFSVYRVCKNTLEKAGGETVWFNEYKALLERGDKQPDPRQQVLDDLEEAIHSIRQDEHHQVIIMMDANESHRKEGKSKLGDFIRRVGLIDCHQYSHPDLKESPTYAEASTQIDYCLVTPDVIDSIKQSGITPLHYAVQGADHRSIWLDLDADMLLGGKVKAPIGPPVRGLKLTNVRVKKMYQDKLQDYIRQHRMREKIEVIAKGLQEADKITKKNEREEGIRRWAEELDKWDKLFTDLMLASERKCNRTGLTRTYLWSRPLVHEGQSITYWKARKKAASSGQCLESLSGYAKYLHEKFSIDDMELSVEEIQQQLKRAWKDL